MEKHSKDSFYEPRTGIFAISYVKSDNPESMLHYHYHNNYEFYYLKTGKRSYFIKDKTYIITPGTIVFINKFDIHSTENYDDVGYERILFNFNDDYVSELLSAVGQEDLISSFCGDRGVITLSAEKRDVCEKILFEMISVYDSERKTDIPYLKASVLQLLLLMHLESKNKSAKVPKEDAAHKTVSQIIGYINNSFADDLTLSFLSEKFYLSSCYLSRTFKKVCGMGFSEYLNNVRIKESKKLLTGTNMSITDICTSVGYKSLTHFGRVFMKITGLSPLSYRKRG